MKPNRRTLSRPTRAARREGRTRRPMLRILHIHEVLLSQRFPNCSTLAQEIEVDRKTIQRDISYMLDLVILQG